MSQQLSIPGRLSNSNLKLLRGKLSENKKTERMCKGIAEMAKG